MDYSVVENLSSDEINDLYFDVVENGGNFTSADYYFSLKHTVTCADGRTAESKWNGSAKSDGNCTDYSKAQIGYCIYSQACDGTPNCQSGTINGKWAVAQRCGYNTYGYACVSACKMDD